MGINKEKNPPNYLSPKQGEYLRADLDDANNETLEKIKEEIYREPPLIFITIPVTNLNPEGARSELVTLSQLVSTMLTVENVSQETVARKISQLMCAIVSYAEHNDIDLREQFSKLYYEYTKFGGIS